MGGRKREKEGEGGRYVSDTPDEGEGGRWWVPEGMSGKAGYEWGGWLAFVGRGRHVWSSNSNPPCSEPKATHRALPPQNTYNHPLLPHTLPLPLPHTIASVPILPSPCPPSRYRTSAPRACPLTT